MDDLFINHLAFMAAHRGSVRFAGRDIFIEGPTPALTSFVPGSPRSVIDDTCRAVRLHPSSGDDWAEKLAALAFRPAESLTYMELADIHSPIVAINVRVTLAESENDADSFADIQASGFATGVAEVDEWWRPYFLQQARSNYDHPAQRFYLGWLEEKPVTTTLVLRGQNVSGVYAVATQPGARSNGVSAAVLERVRRDALASGFPRIILQAMTGSYAEG